MTDATVFDHYRTDGDGGVPPGVYRVVGVDGERTTLLRLADGDGRRLHEGRVERVRLDAPDSAFRPAANPDAGVHPIRALRGLVDGLRWRIRSAFGR